MWPFAVALAGAMGWPGASTAHREFFRKLAYKPPVPGSYALPVVQPAADGTVIDAAGTRHRLFDLMARKYALLALVYTSCSDAKGCPLATHVMREIADVLGDDRSVSGRLRILMLSFDPERDTPETIRKFARQSDPGLKDRAGMLGFLTTESLAQLDPILDGYGQYVVPDDGGGEGFTRSYSHVLKIFLIDREKRVRNIYSVSYLHPQIIVNDIRTLMMEQGTAKGPAGN